MPNTPLEIISFIVVLLIVFYFKREEIKTAFFGNKNGTKKVQNDINEGFIELVDLLIHSMEKQSLVSYISTIPSQINSTDEIDKEGYALEYLEKIVEYIDENDGWFISYVDWKESVSEVVWYIKDCLADRGIEIDPLTSSNDPESMSISADGAFSDINKHLKPYDIQMGYIDNYSDSYHLILYELKSQKKVELAINKIGLPYRQDIT